jgi:predicted anti-sigma-YlaC factor YlaD
MSDPMMLTCQEMVELVTNYLEGALSPADQERFEQHIHMCSGCDHYLGQIEDTIRATGKLREDTVPQEALERLLGAFREWKTRK